MASTPTAAGHARSERQRSTDLFAAAQGLTGIAALVLGLTYAIGASLRAGELREAGVDVREGLAVVPIEQLLTRGIDALLDPRNVVLFAALFLLAAFAAASGWAMKRRVEGYERRLDDELAEQRAQMSSHVARVDDPDEKARIDERLRHEREWRKQELEGFREYAKNAPRNAQARSALLAGVVLVIVVVGFVPWAYGVAVVVGVTLLALLAVAVWRTGTPPNPLALFAGLLIVVASGIIVEGQVNPRPPATVVLTLKSPPAGVARAFASGHEDSIPAVSGRLVAVTDQGWYISSADEGEDDTMLTMARDEVAAGVTTRVRRDVESVAEVVWDWAF